MSYLLLELAQNYFLGSTGRQTSVALGESEASVRAGLPSVVPLVLGALLVHARRPGGAAELATEAQQVYGHGLLGNLSELLARLPASPAPEPSTPADPGPERLRALLGDDYPAAVAGISQQAGLRPASVSNLVQVTTAVVLGLLGRHAAQQNLGATELASYLASQLDTVQHALQELPSEVSSTLPNLLSGPPRTASIVMRASNPTDHPTGLPKLAAAPVAEPRAAPLTSDSSLTAPIAGAVDGDDSPGRATIPPRQEAGPTATARTTPRPARTTPRPARAMPANSRQAAAGHPAAQPSARLGRYWPWLLGVLGLLLVLLGYFQWGRASQPAPAPSATGTAATPAPVGSAARPRAPLTGHYEEASDTYRYDPGPALVVQLPTGTKLRVGEQTAEAQLFYLLTGSPQARPDPAQAGLRLGQVDFEAGTATLTPASQAQLANLAALLQAFPKAQLKVGGFTDAQGPAEASLLRSADCANAVRNALLARGVAPGRVVAQGYGQDHPLASNATREGRAQNRRVAILLTAK